jgi:hypothetical protein
MMQAHSFIENLEKDKFAYNLFHQGPKIFGDFGVLGA